MRLKANTTKSSDHLRGIAGVVNAMGIVLGVFLEIIGISNILGNSSFLYIRAVLGFVVMVFGLLIMFWHYVAYVMISAYATVIENSDRTDVVAALFDINDTLHMQMVNSVEYNTVNRKYRDSTEKKYTDNSEDVELEKIDISDIDKE